MQRDIPEPIQGTTVSAFITQKHTLSITPIRVNGIGSKHTSNSYIRLQVYFISDHSIAKTSVEVYIIKDLHA